MSILLHKQIEAIGNFNCYSDGCIQFKGLFSTFNGAMAQFQIIVDAGAKVDFIYDEGNSKGRTYTLPFYRFFTFVIDKQNLYVDDKIIPLKNLRNIFIDEIKEV